MCMCVRMYIYIYIYHECKIINDLIKNTNQQSCIVMIVLNQGVSGQSLRCTVTKYSLKTAAVLVGRNMRL